MSKCKKSNYLTFPVEDHGQTLFIKRPILLTGTIEIIFHYDNFYHFLPE
jgi:hypothetical protein